jgi:hypothetical protein
MGAAKQGKNRMLTGQSTVLPERIVVHTSQKTLLQSEYLKVHLRYSTEAAIGPYREPDTSSLHTTYYPNSTKSI